MSQESSERPFDLDDRFIDFAVRIISVVEALPRSRTGNHIAGQLVRSGTSPGPTTQKLKAPSRERTSSTN